MVFVPAYVSEFPDKLVRDCVPASGLMLTNKITHNKYPASVAEREALQNAMGTQDQGADNNELAAGIRKLFGISLTPSSGWPELASLLTKPEYGAAVIGEYQEIPLYIRNQGRQPSYNGLHEIYVQSNGAGGIVIGDPLGYGMVQAGIGDVQNFATSWHTAQQWLAGKENPVIVGYRLNIGPGSTQLWRVMRFTHYLYGRRPVGWDHVSHAPLAHGAKGFWMITAGGLTGYYAVYGHTNFTVTALYSDGSQKGVSAAS